MAAKVLWYDGHCMHRHLYHYCRVFWSVVWESGFKYSRHFRSINTFFGSIKMNNIKAPRHKAESRSFPKSHLVVETLPSCVKIILLVIKPRLLPFRIRQTIPSRQQLKFKIQTLRLRRQRPYRKRD